MSEVIGLEVLDLAAATALGRVDGVVVECRPPGVRSLQVGKRFVDWETLESIGSDAVTIADSDRLREPASPSEKAADDGVALLGSRALSDVGTELGEVQEVEFSETDGAITRIVVGDHAIDGEDLVAIGPFATIVSRSRQRHVDAG